MTKINDGGPAFPHPNADYAPDHPHHVSNRAFGGMSLRDWFAGQALVGLAATATEGTELSVVVAAAYEAADAMLKAREGGAP